MQGNKTMDNTKRKESLKRYNQSDHGKARHERYQQSTLFKETQRRYQNSSKGRLTKKRAHVRRRCRVDGLSEAEIDCVLRNKGLI